MQTQKMQVDRASIEGLKQAIHVLRESFRHKDCYEADSLRSVVEFVLRPALAQAESLATAGLHRYEYTPSKQAILGAKRKHERRIADGYELPGAPVPPLPGTAEWRDRLHAEQPNGGAS